MTTIKFEEPQFSPRPLPKAEKRTVDPGTASKASAYARIPLFVVLGANLVVYLRHWVPELQLIPHLQVVVDQVSVLVAPVASQGVPVSPYALTSPRPALVLLVAAILLAVSAVRGGPWRVLVPLSAAAVVSSAAVILYENLGSDLRQVATGLLLLPIVAVTAALTGIRSVRVPGTALPPVKPIRVRWLVLATLTGVIPYAIGRHAFARDLTGIAAEVYTVPAWTPSLLENPTTALLVAAGFAILLGGFSLLRLLPPWKGRKLIGPANRIDGLRRRSRRRGDGPQRKSDPLTGGRGPSARGHFAGPRRICHPYPLDSSPPPKAVSPFCWTVVVAQSTARFPIPNHSREVIRSTVRATVLGGTHGMCHDRRGNRRREW